MGGAVFMTLIYGVGRARALGCIMISRDEGEIVTEDLHLGMHPHIIIML
jgi:hypothetical protein